MAQTKYYSQTKTFYENGYTYQCDVDAGEYITLYNKDNKLTYVNLTYNGSQRLPPIGVFGRIPFITNDEQMLPTAWDIVYNAFTKAQRLKMVEARLSIALCISKDTGKVMEVKFNFYTWDTLNTIPIATFRKIETEIKDKIKITPLEEAKKLNYIFYGWNQPITIRYEDR
jgi:hypothetical protein